MKTKQLQVPINFSYKSFGNDEFDEAQFCFIHKDTLIFNQDLVDRVNLESAGKSSIQTIMYLKDGMIVKKLFDVTDNSLVEIKA